MEIKKLVTVEWNTGALYTSAGQPMRADLFQLGTYDYVILFQDRGRQIDGIVPVLGHQFFVKNETRNSVEYDAIRIKEYVQLMYMRNQYESWSTYCKGGTQVVTIQQLKQRTT
jgi:hypothetical protein